MRRRSFVWIAIFVCVCCAGGAKAHAETVQVGQVKDVIERMYLRRASPHDPGTITVLFRNDRETSVKISKLQINGHDLAAWPASTNPVAWHRLTSDELSPGQAGLLQAKLVQPLHGVVRLSLELNGLEHHVLMTADAADPVHVAAVRYGPQGECVNIFVENTGKAEETLKHVEFDGRSVWSAPGEGLSLLPGKLAVARVKLDEPLKPAQRLMVTLRLADRPIAVSDRAIPGFRISTETGNQDMAQRIGADPLVLQSFQFHQQPTDDKSTREAAPSLVKRQGSHWSLIRVTHGRYVSEIKSDLACVFACPTHATDSYQTSAYLASLAQQQLEKEGAWQSFIHACRTQPLQGIAVFGPLSDGVRFNAQIETALSGKVPHRDQVPWRVYRLTQYAARTACPRWQFP